MKKLLILLFLVIEAIPMHSCNSKGNSTVDKMKKTDAVKEKEANISTWLTSQQIKTIGIELGEIENKQLTASLKTNGVLKVPNQNRASINSIYNGIIQSIWVQPGNNVSKGQTVATISNPDFIRIQQEYLAVNSKIVLAEKEYNRQKELNAGNAGALKNLQAADAEFQTLRSSRASLQQQIQLMGINPASLMNGKFVSELSIRSPISGVVSNVILKIGSYADANTIIAEVVDNNRLHLDLFVYEKDLPKIKNNQIIHFTLTNNPGKEYDALIYSLGSSFEGESKAVTVHATVRGNKTGLIDGMSITAVVSLGKNTVPAVPSNAIVNYEGQDYIFFVDSVDDVGHTTRFKRIPVAKGTSDVGYNEITLLQKIPVNAQTVIKGAFFILAKQTNVGEKE